MTLLETRELLVSGRALNAGILFTGVASEPLGEATVKFTPETFFSIVVGALSVGMLMGSPSGAEAATSSSVIGAAHDRVVVPISCAPAGGAPCRFSLSLSATEPTHAVHNRFERKVLVGSATALLPDGQSRRVAVKLNATGRKLLTRRRSLRLILTVISTRLSAPAVPQQPRSFTPPQPPSPLPAPVCTATTFEAEPTSAPGPTALIGLLPFAERGPPRMACEGLVQSESGTVEVLNSSGEVVGTQTVAQGQQFDIPVPPGTYTVIGAPGSSANFLYRSAPTTAIEGEQVAVVLMHQGPSIA